MPNFGSINAVSPLFGERSVAAAESDHFGNDCEDLIFQRAQ